MPSRFRSAKVLASLALLSGCAVAPQQGAPEVGESSEAMLYPVPLTLDPVSLCSSTTADVSIGYPSSPGYRFQGTSDASKSCDYYVVETTGVHQKDLTLAVAAQPHLITDQTSCQNSFETFVTFGYIPQHWEMNGQGLWYPVAAKWQQISTKTISGQWLSNVLPGQVNCAFNAFVNLYGAGDVAGGNGLFTGGSYTVVRVATKAVLYTAGVPARTNMDTYVVPAP